MELHDIECAENVTVGFIVMRTVVKLVSYYVLIDIIIETGTLSLNIYSILLSRSRRPDVDN